MEFLKRNFIIIIIIIIFDMKRNFIISSDTSDEIVYSNTVPEKRNHLRVSVVPLCNSVNDDPF